MNLYEQRLEGLRTYTFVLQSNISRLQTLTHNHRVLNDAYQYEIDRQHQQDAYYAEQLRQGTESLNHYSAGCDALRQVLNGPLTSTCGILIRRTDTVRSHLHTAIETSSRLRQTTDEVADGILATFLALQDASDQRQNARWNRDQAFAMLKQMRRRVEMGMMALADLQRQHHSLQTSATAEPNSLPQLRTVTDKLVFLLRNGIEKRRVMVEEKKTALMNLAARCEREYSDYKRSLHAASMRHDTEVPNRAVSGDWRGWDKWSNRMEGTCVSYRLGVNNGIELLDMIKRGMGRIKADRKSQRVQFQIALGKPFDSGSFRQAHYGMLPDGTK